MVGTATAPPVRTQMVRASYRWRSGGSAEVERGAPASSDSRDSDTRENQNCTHAENAELAETNVFCVFHEFCVSCRSSCLRVFVANVSLSRE